MGCHVPVRTVAILTTVLSIAFILSSICNTFAAQCRFSDRAMSCLRSPIGDFTRSKVLAPLASVDDTVGPALPANSEPCPTFEAEEEFAPLSPSPTTNPPPCPNVGTGQPALDAGCKSAREQEMKKAAGEWSVGTFNDSVPCEVCDWIPLLGYNSNIARVEPLHILFYGDSGDRYIVEDGCNKALLYNGTLHNWASTIIRYEENGTASAMCRTDWGTFSFVHLYGSAPTGPYMRGHVNADDDPYTDTPLRIRKTYEHYKDQFGHEPHLVVYQSNLWDVSQYPAGPMLTFYSDNVKRYHKNIGDNIELLKSIASSNVTVMLRTTPFLGHRPSVAPFNAAIREIGQTQCVGVLDWATMVSFTRLEQPNKGPPKRIFRDSLHLSEVQSAAFLKAVKEFAENYVLPSLYAPSM